MKEWWKTFTNFQEYEKGSKDGDKSKEADGARRGRVYLVLGEPTRLEARHHQFYWVVGATKPALPKSILKEFRCKN